MHLKPLLLYKALDLFEEIVFFFMKLFGCSKEADHFESLIACFFVFRMAFQLVRLAVCLLKFIRISGFDLSLLLHPLGWRCVECPIHHERNVLEEQHPYTSGANKQ